MERGHAQVEAQFVYRLQTLGGFGGKADQLNAYSVFLERSRATSSAISRDTPASRSRICIGAVRKYLRSDNRVVVSVVPKGKLVARAAGLHAGGGVVTRADRTRLPAVGPPLPFRFSRINKDRLLESACRSGRPNIGRFRSSRSCWCCPSARPPTSRGTKGSRPSPAT